MLLADAACRAARVFAFAVEQVGDGWRVTESDRSPVAFDEAPPSWMHRRRIGGIALKGTLPPGWRDTSLRIEPHHGRILAVDNDRIVHVFDLGRRVSA